MIYTDLYNDVLIKPCEQGADKLRIVSGFATPAMATRHLVSITEKHLHLPRIELIVGMCPANTISISNHRGFTDLANDQAYKGLFCCSYVCTKPAVHTKLYIWYKNNALYKAFIGSANYTQNAFFGSQREALDIVSNIDEAQDYFDLIAGQSIYCTHPDAEDMVGSDKTTVQEEISHNNGVRVSLLTKQGTMPSTSGLNWGQRDKRNHNQAYLALPPEVYRSDFFPKSPECFTVRTDDDKYMICRRAQKTKTNEGHSIHTPGNNALLGEYFRNRLGLANGAFVTKDDLLRYGRTDVVFYKLDNDDYYMDFSVKP